ncbi:MAG: type II toxin-antitoxin system VapC family toxin [Gammaproteobacteria bacterium]|nr:type II toxin-antitoxin system VapC family toxin [Gammaproteobacteria bacterium]
MIAIDTNVLLRYLLQDDRDQSPKTTKLLADREKVLITDVVLVKTVWTLRGKKYKLAKADVITVLHQLFQEPTIVFEDNQSVWNALHDYQTAATGNDVDFADTLILEKAQYDTDMKAESFNGLYTFDVDLQQLDQTKKP